MSGQWWQVCEWWPLCARDAAGLRDHPVLGRVPICRECDAKVSRLDLAARA